MSDLVSQLSDPVHRQEPRVKKPRKAATRKKPQGRKTAIMFAVSIVLAVANLLLFIKLGIAIR